MSVFAQPNPLLSSSDDSESVDYSNEPQPEFGDPDHSYYYEQAMKGDFTGAQRDKPECGYYRTRSLNPVGIWLENGLTLIKIGEGLSVPFDPSRHEAYWMWARRNPVAKRYWLNHVYSGIPWPDLPETPALVNEPEDPYDNWKARIDGKLEFARQWVKDHPKITIEADASFATNLGNEIRDLEAEGDRLYETEKKPFEDGLKNTRDRYRVRDNADKARGVLKDLRQAYLIADRLKKQAEAEAERKRLQAEADAKAAAERAAAKTEGRKPEPAATVVVPMPEINKTLIGGARGNRESLQINYEDVTILDHVAAYMHLRLVDPKLDAEVLRSAKAFAKKWKEDTRLPGTIVKDNLGKVICDYTPKPQTKPASKKRVKSS